MALDIFSFSDFALGGESKTLGVVSFLIALSIPLFVTSMGFYWVACCREWMVVNSFFQLVDKSIISGSAIGKAPGASQLIFCEYLTLLSVCGFSSTVFVYPIITNFWIPFSVAFPFWFSSVAFTFKGISWYGSFAGTTYEGYVSSFANFALESVTVVLRVFTLALRIFLNLMIGLALVKLFFSLGALSCLLDKGLYFSTGSFGFVNMILFGLGFGLYWWDWFVAFLQVWLFTFLSVSYFDGYKINMKEVVKKN